MASILIVDDESSVRTLLTRWMQGLGHEILEAESADAALQVMEKQPAAVVFTDIQMPERDGLWLTAEVRTRYRTTAVVLATSVSAIAPQVSMQAGVLAYLVKPLRPPIGPSRARHGARVALKDRRDRPAP
jgi:CheY-like chemotaxis protein